MVEKFLPGKEINYAGGSFWEMELGDAASPRLLWEYILCNDDISGLMITTSTFTQR